MEVMGFDLMQMIGTVGVPGALCFVLITNFKKAIDNMSKSIDNNTQAIVAITTLVKGVNGNVSE